MVSFIVPKGYIVMTFDIVNNSSMQKLMFLKHADSTIGGGSVLILL